MTARERPRSRGRRPAGEDARGDIVAAARAEFAANGYDGTTLRGIARAAGVDPRLVHHYFDGKDDLFSAALDIPVTPQQIILNLTGGEPDRIGERVVRFFFTVWDTPDGRDRLRALISSVATTAEAVNMIRDFLTRQVFATAARTLQVGDPDLRAALTGSQLIGAAMARYVLEVEPLASATVEDLVRHLAPTVQRYLAGPLPGAGPGAGAGAGAGADPGMGDGVDPGAGAGPGE